VANDRDYIGLFMPQYLVELRPGHRDQLGVVRVQAVVSQIFPHRIVEVSAERVDRDRLVFQVLRRFDVAVSEDKKLAVDVFINPTPGHHAEDFGTAGDRIDNCRSRGAGQVN